MGIHPVLHVDLPRHDFQVFTFKPHCRQPCDCKLLKAHSFKQVDNSSHYAQLEFIAVASAALLVTCSLDQQHAELCHLIHIHITSAQLLTDSACPRTNRLVCCIHKCQNDTNAVLHREESVRIGLIVGVSCLLCSSAMPGVWSFLRVTPRKNESRNTHEPAQTAVNTGSRKQLQKTVWWRCQQYQTTPQHERPTQGQCCN